MSKLQQSHILLATQGLRECSEGHEAQNCASECTVVVGKKRSASQRNKLVCSQQAGSWAEPTGQLMVKGCGMSSMCRITDSLAKTRHMRWASDNQIGYFLECWVCTRRNAFHSAQGFTWGSSHFSGLQCTTGNLKRTRFVSVNTEPFLKQELILST